MGRERGSVGGAGVWDTGGPPYVEDKDAELGHRAAAFLARLARGVGLLGQVRPERRISLIDMPLWVSSHPEPPTKRSRAFGNSSIILHGLKGNSTDWLWEDAQQRGAGPYEPPPSRRCDTCRKMGWATWPGSVAKAWRCCGRAVRRRAIRLDPRTVDEGMNTTAWSQEEQRLRLAAMRRGGLQR